MSQSEAGGETFISPVLPAAPLTSRLVNNVLWSITLEDYVLLNQLFAHQVSRVLIIDFHYVQK